MAPSGASGGTYIIRRLLQVIPVLLGISLVAFVLVRLTGDPAAILLPPEASAEAVAEFRREFGLDQPLHVQYFQFLSKALQGDFGRSIRYREPVLTLFLERFPATVELAVVSLSMAILMGIPIGVFTAVKQNTWVDTFARCFALAGQAIPGFYLALSSFWSYPSIAGCCPQEAAERPSSSSCLPSPWPSTSWQSSYVSPAARSSTCSARTTYAPHAPKASAKGCCSGDTS